MIDKKQGPKSKRLFDDDFAEASIEAISIAALRCKQPNNSDSNIDNFAPSPTTTTTSITQLLSSLLCCYHHPSQSHPKLPESTSSLDEDRATAIPASSSGSLPLPSARVPLVHHHRKKLWYQHVLSLPHNAIRAELIDLCAMLDSLNNDPKPSFNLLQQWYQLFRSFLSSYLAFEHTVLLPWVYAGVDDERLIDFERSMVPERALIAHLLDELANALTLVSSRPLQCIMPVLIRAVTDLVTPLLSYLRSEQRVLPNLINARRSRLEAVNLERLMLNQMDVGLLLRWVPYRSHRMLLRLKYLPLSKLVAYPFQGRIHTARHLAVVRTIVGPPHPT